MREIKFRAFDKKEMKMIPSIGLTEDGTPFIMKSVYKEKVGDELIKQNASCLAFGKEEVVVMQFTGLKDKNGVEIYEGDIVKRGIGDYNKPVNNGELSVIEWRDRGFWIKEEVFGWEGEGLWDWNMIEVIGNIYEHPHLLTPSDSTQDKQKVK